MFAVIELACGEYGEDKIEALVQGTENGRSLKWFDNPNALLDAKTLRGKSILLIPCVTVWCELCINLFLFTHSHESAEEGQEG